MTQARFHTLVSHTYIVCTNPSWPEVGWGVGVRRVNASSLLCCHADILRKSYAIVPSLTTHPHAVWPIQLYALALNKSTTPHKLCGCAMAHITVCVALSERGVAEVG
jgi:hypothetical protein